MLAGELDKDGDRFLSRLMEPVNLVETEEVVVEAFVEELRKPGLSVDRKVRLLAYVRRRKSEELVELAREWAVSGEEEVRWHCLEILLRNGWRREDLPTCPGVKRRRILLHEPTGLCLVWIPPGVFRMGSEAAVA